MRSALKSRVLSTLYKILGTAAIFRALYNYYRNGRISHEAWMALLRAHCASNGRATERLNPIIRVLRPPRRSAPANGLLGYFGVEEQKTIARTIARDGFYVFPNRL